MRQRENECADLRFLVQQKEQAVSRLQSENVKLREKLDKALEKLYMPS